MKFSATPEKLQSSSSSSFFSTSNTFSDTQVSTVFQKKIDELQKIIDEKNESQKELLTMIDAMKEKFENVFDTFKNTNVSIKDYIHKSNNNHEEEVSEEVFEELNSKDVNDQLQRSVQNLHEENNNNLVKLLDKTTDTELLIPIHNFQNSVHQMVNSLLLEDKKKKQILQRLYDLETENQTLIQKVQVLFDEMQDLREVSEERASTCETLKYEIKNLKEDYECLKQDNRSLKLEIQELTDVNNSYSEEIQSLKEKLESSHQEKKELKSIITDLEISKAKLLEQINFLNDTLTRQQDSDSTVESLNKKIEFLEAELSNKDKLIAQKDLINKYLSAQFDERKMKQQQDETIQKQDEEIKRLKAQAEDLKANLSLFNDKLANANKQIDLSNQKYDSTFDKFLEIIKNVKSLSKEVVLSVESCKKLKIPLHDSDITKIIQQLNSVPDPTNVASPNQLLVSTSDFKFNDIVIFFPNGKGQYLALSAANVKPHYLSQDSITAANVETQKPLFLVGKVICYEGNYVATKNDPYGVANQTSYSVLTAQLL